MEMTTMHKPMPVIGQINLKQKPISQNEEKTIGN